MLFSHQETKDVHRCSGSNARLLSPNARSRLFTPEEFDFAKANSIANLDTGLFKSLGNAHFAQRHLQTIHALFILRVGHIDGTLNTFTTHHIDASLFGHSESIFWLRTQNGPVRIRYYYVRRSFRLLLANF